MTTPITYATHAFLWENGQMQDLGALLASPEDDSHARAINGPGQVVGWSATDVGGSFWDHAFFIEPSDTDDDGTPDTWYQDADNDGINDLMTDLGLLAPAGDPGDSKAYAINNSGQVVGESDLQDFNGTHAFLWENGAMTDLGTLNGSSFSVAYDINNPGQVVGQSSGRGFLWENGAMTELGGIKPAAINNAGQVVGSACIDDGEESCRNHAYIWQNGEEKDLNDLIDPASGWSLGEATDINDEGQIVGLGSVNGESHAVLLTPGQDATDTTAPTTSATTSPAPYDAGWHNKEVTVTIGVADGESGVKEITYSASGAQPIASKTVPGTSTDVVIGTEGETAITYSATNNAGKTAAETTVAIKLDKTAPTVQCGSADDQWHKEDVTVDCPASDAGSGLSNPADASFMLSTNVPEGTETDNAETNSRAVCDVAGNCQTAGPVGGNKVDKKVGFSGRVIDPDNHPLADAPVQVCPHAGGACAWSGKTDYQGNYRTPDLPDGSYDITAFPPASSDLIKKTIGPLDTPGNLGTDQDIQLGSPDAPPAGTETTPSRTGAGGIPIV